MKRLSMALALAGVFLFLSVASASAARVVPKSNRIGIDLGIFSGSLSAAGTSDVLSISPELEAWIKAGPILIEARVGIPIIKTTVGTVEETEAGGAHVFAAVHYAKRGNRVDWRAGVGLSFNTTDADRTAKGLRRLAAAVSTGVVRGQRIYMSRLKTVSIVPSFAYQYRLGQLFTQADLALGIMIGTTDLFETELDVEMGASVGGKFGPVKAGLRLQYWWMPTEDGDNFQLALVPFVDLEMKAWFFGTRLVMNLDEPAGFAFDTGKIWGLHFSVGAKI